MGGAHPLQQSLPETNYPEASGTLDMTAGYLGGVYSYSIKSLYLCTCISAHQGE